jgi:hypothetical protein
MGFSYWQISIKKSKCNTGEPVIRGIAIQTNTKKINSLALEVQRNAEDITKWPSKSVQFILL